MNIKTIREKHGLPRESAARIINRSARTVQDWERGVSNQDDALVDYLALLTGEMTLDDARERAIERAREPKK